MLMRTKADTLTVNPAFLQEIKDSNQDLWHTLGQIRTLCCVEESRNENAKLLVKLLGVLRDHLALQFTLEESYGYMECPGFIEQRVCEYADRARAQHYRLYLQLGDLCELAEELQFRGFSSGEVERLIEDTLAFDVALQEHEQVENDLIEIAYFDLKHSESSAVSES